MRIPESKIEEIRSAANIVDVVSSYVQLRKRGSNFLGLCPFHHEKTPSFTVSENKQIYHCFGCHAGGNVFKFLMEYKKISYVESVQELAEELGITIEYDERQVEVQSEQEILYDINTTAAKYFSNNLLTDENGEGARKYFTDRKLKTQSLRSFGLGYAFPYRESFVKYAREMKLDLDKCQHLGLIGRYDDGNYFDKFAGRIIFPIFSPNGRVVAFAGRILENRENIAKYLNSPESSIYHKGRILYGLSHAKDEIRKQNRAILVEGYMDLISLHQHGIKNVVAVSGTALTEEQIQLISRYTKNIILLFDADTAGVKASMRSIELLLKQDMEVRVITLPQGEDPDSYVHNYGKDKFDELVKTAKTFLEYQTAHYESQGDLEDPIKLTEVIKELVKTLALIKDDIKRSVLLKNISRKYGIRENLLEAELDKIININAKTTENKSANPQVMDKKAKEDIQIDESSKIISDVRKTHEQTLIKLLFEGDKRVLNFIFEHIHPEDFYMDDYADIMMKVLKEYFDDNDISASSLLDKFDDELQKKINDLITEKIVTFVENENPNLFEKALSTVKRFLSLKIDEQIKDTHKRIEECDDEDLRIAFMKNINELLISKKEIGSITFE